MCCLDILASSISIPKTWGCSSLLRTGGSWDESHSIASSYRILLNGPIIRSKLEWNIRFGGVNLLSSNLGISAYDGSCLIYVFAPSFQHSSSIFLRLLSLRILSTT